MLALAAVRGGGCLVLLLYADKKKKLVFNGNHLTSFNATVISSFVK